MEPDINGKGMQVLVAYDDCASGQRAMALMKRVNTQCGGRRRLTHVMRQFDLMSDPAFFELAVSEALAADIVVIAAAEGRELPQRIKNWIVRWLLMKGERPQALVATLDYNFPHARERACVHPYLAKLAGFGNLKFFSNGKPNDKTEVGTLQSNSFPTEHVFAQWPAMGLN